MRTDVSALVIGMDVHVHSHKVIHDRVCEAQHPREVARPVKRFVVRVDFPVLEQVTIDSGSRFRQTGNQVQTVVYTGSAKG